MAATVDPSAPLPKYTSDRDFTTALNAITSVCLVLGTGTIISRFFARRSQNVTILKASLDDYFAIFSYLAFLGHIVANYLITRSGMLTPEGPKPQYATSLQAALNSTAFLQPFTIAGSKLSLLFLIRRIFGTRVTWFKISWWLNLLLIFPVWLALAFTCSGLTLGGIWTFQESLQYAIPSISFTNAGSDLFMMILPIKTTSNLRMDWRRRTQVIGVFAIGFIATAISIARGARAVENAREGWDPRYSLFESASLSTPEQTACILCASLPVARPALERWGSSIKSSISSSFFTISTFSSGSWNRTGKSTARTYTRQTDEDGSVALNERKIRRTVEVDVETQDRPKSFLSKSNGSSQF